MNKGTRIPRIDATFLLINIVNDYTVHFIQS